LVFSLNFLQRSDRHHRLLLLLGHPTKCSFFVLQFNERTDCDCCRAASWRIISCSDDKLQIRKNSIPSSNRFCRFRKTSLIWRPPILQGEKKRYRRQLVFAQQILQTALLASISNRSHPTCR
jgi:hypothetical protein